ncbi:hypothetical protein ACFXOI_13155 [Streptomyces bacillaris]|uniref:hypothetical protein n=1 Tax=Streptomyces bacillaris TaxID=68179 RepID=UPI003686F45B
MVPPRPSYAPYAPSADLTAGLAADLTFMAIGPDTSLLVDSTGVTLGPEGAEAQYTWAEILTVQYAAEGPKHLRVVVHLHDGTAHPCLLAARKRARLQEWLEDLPLILECFV